MTEVGEVKVEQRIISGETSAIRRIHPEIPEELRILEEIDRDPNRVDWFESRPGEFKPKSKDELIDFATSDKDHLIYAVSGAKGLVPDDEVGKLQGWVLIKPEIPRHVQDMLSSSFITEEAASNPIVEFEYARRDDAVPGQMASAVRQAAIHLASASLELTHETPFPPHLTVAAYLIDKEPQNTPSAHVLEAAGFEEVGKLRFDDEAERPDRLFILNWKKLMDIERQKINKREFNDENVELQSQVKSEVFDKTPEAWQKIGEAAQDLVLDAFGPELSGSLLGITDDVVSYSDLESAFMDPDSVAVLLKGNDGQVAGFTLSIPIGKMNPERASESKETAYIYFTVLGETFRGKKLVGKMMDPLFEELQRRGFGFVERDCLIKDGYADKVQRQYVDSTVESYDHERFPEVGPERFFRIDIDKYLKNQTPVIPAV